MPQAQTKTNAQAMLVALAGLTAASFSGTGPTTTCKAPQGMPITPNAAPATGLVLQAYAAIKAAYPQQTAPYGFAKGTQAFYAYLAWYSVACAGKVLTKQKAAIGAPGYTNANNGAQVPLPAGHTATASGTLGRLSQHAVWHLRKALQNYTAKQAAQAQA